MDLRCIIFKALSTNTRTLSLVWAPDALASCNNRNDKRNLCLMAVFTKVEIYEISLEALVISCYDHCMNCLTAGLKRFCLQLSFGVGSFPGIKIFYRTTGGSSILTNCINGTLKDTTR